MPLLNSDSPGPSSLIARSTRRTILIVLCAASVLGCGTAEYNRRMTEGASSPAGSSGGSGDILFADSLALGFGSIRLPTFIDSSAKTLQADTAGAQPPFLTMPGYRFTYQVDSESGPVFCYFGVDESSTQDQIMQQVQTQVANTFSGASWSDIELSNGTMKRMSVSGNQDFGGSSAAGRFDLYLFTSGSKHILVGWRCSDAAAQQLNVFSAAQASMATLSAG